MEPAALAQPSGWVPEGYCTPGSTRKKKVRFLARHDVMLLRKVVVQNPYSLNESRHAWTRISEEMNAALQDEGFEVDYRRCRERTSLLLHYYKRQNFAGLRRWGTESLYMEKEHLLDQVMALESGKSLPMTPETSYKDTSDEALAVTITEETLRKVQEEGLWQQSVQEAKEEAEYSDSEAPLPKRVCQGCCQTYSELLLLQERRAQVEQRLREDELAVRREELQIEKEKLALERERLDTERRERERRFELESQERQMILDILKEKMMRK